MEMNETAKGAMPNSVPGATIVKMRVFKNYALSPFCLVYAPSG